MRKRDKEPKAPKQKKAKEPKAPRRPLVIVVSPARVVFYLLGLVFIAFFTGYTIYPVVNQPDIQHLGRATLYMLCLAAGLGGAVVMGKFIIRSERDAPQGKHMSGWAILALIALIVGGIRLTIDLAHPAPRGGYNDDTIQVSVALAILLLLVGAALVDMFRTRKPKPLKAAAISDPEHHPAPPAYHRQDDQPTEGLGTLNAMLG